MSIYWLALGNFHVNRYDETQDPKCHHKYSLVEIYSFFSFANYDVENSGNIFGNGFSLLASRQFHFSKCGVQYVHSTEVAL